MNSSEQDASHDDGCWSLGPVSSGSDNGDDTLLLTLSAACRSQQLRGHLATLWLHTAAVQLTVVSIKPAPKACR